jgi:hypothetical protein
MKKLLLTAAAFMIMSATTGATAQVTIGSTADPQPFSILELVGNNARGLRLPQMTTAQRDNMVNSAEFQAEKSGKARGLQIFNTKTKCVETWNGTTWIAACGEPDPWVEPPVISGCKYGSLDMVIPPVRFAKYNLGADSTLDTPKKQMKYLAETNYPKSTNGVTLQLDATVNGGLYQWGRKWDKTSDATSYPVSVENNTYKRYTGNGSGGTTHSASMSGFTLANDYDSYGQPKEAHAGDHLDDGSGANNYDWLVKDESSPIWNSTLGMAPDRWGNGKGLSADGTADNGGVLYNGSYYQNTNREIKSNDPCPSGFRVPTQDEWERLGAYNCNPDNASGYFQTSITGVLSNETKGNGRGLTWIPVVCNTVDYPGRCVPSTGWTENTTSSGYAIYDTEEWTAATTSGGVYAAWASEISPTATTFNDKNGNDYKYPSLHADAAPEPLLFLPAAGYRGSNSGTVNYTGNQGYYWSSTVVDTYSLYLNFNSGYVYPSGGSFRANGYSVRCVAE